MVGELILHSTTKACCSQINNSNRQTALEELPSPSTLAGGLSLEGTGERKETSYKEVILKHLFNSYLSFY